MEVNFMKKTFSTLLILLIISFNVNAKTYYYKDLNNIVNSSTTYPFCDGENCSYNNTNNIDIEFMNSSSSYDISDKNLEEGFTLDEGTGSAELSFSTSGDNIIDGTITLSESNGTITIPAFSSDGTVNIILTATEDGNIVDQDTLEIIVVDQSAEYGDGFVTTWGATCSGQRMPTTSGYTYNGTINWGDGNGDIAFTSYNDIAFNCPDTAEDKTVIIKGTFEALNTSDKQSLPMKTVEQLGKVGWKTFVQAFYGLKITSFKSRNVDTSNVTSMAYMFRNTRDLTSIEGISEWNTSGVNNMAGMFSFSMGLSTLDLSGWDTSNVVYMNSMFSYANNLTNIEGISNLNTSSVINMNQMFYNAAKLTNLNLSGWDTSAVTDMREMFFNAVELTNLNLSGWDTSNVIYMSDMFSRAYNLESIIGMSEWNVSSVIEMISMFSENSGLTTVGDLSGWNTSNVSNMSHMFYNTSSLTSVGDISGWDVSSMDNSMQVYNMFEYSGIPEMDIPYWYYMLTGTGM